MKQKCYKKERIRPLKTPRQVRHYMRCQTWYQSFKGLVITEWTRPTWERLRTLWGFNGKKTIKTAFIWSDTLQGYNHWEVINERFERWYEKQ